MTNANRKSCEEWSVKSTLKSNLICESCGKQLAHKKGPLYICTECGLEQEFTSKKSPMGEIFFPNAIDLHGMSFEIANKVIRERITEILKQGKNTIQIIRGHRIHGSSTTFKEFIDLGQFEATMKKYYITVKRIQDEEQNPGISTFKIQSQLSKNVKK